MAESESCARLKKTLESSKELTKTTRENVDKERFKILEIISKDIVESKIDEKEAMLKALAELYNETEVEAINALKLDEDQEKKKLSAEYESIVKKQLQMLQADERGKQALLNEISNIKQEQRKRSEALKARKKALLVEKERSKRIAALPPPLPKSVKLLLKGQDKREPDTLTGLHPSRPQEQEFYPVEEEIDVFEDKENMDDDDLYNAQRKQQQEEWNRKAKKRFNEAIRKDRQKQEHAKILKEIEEADKTSRRLMARSLTEPGGTVPCPLSDRLNHMEKQAVLEDAVEKVFNKSKPTKEHAIEDLEGYEDKWEAKYKRIDSTLEAKMIDCVPNFLKQNYSYLLEEEPARPCGNRFGRLNDSAEDLNEAYIESPTDKMSGSDKIAAVLSHLDQMMTESNELLERDFKPLLKAEGLKADQPKRGSFDKAVEANILKQPTEDKSTSIRGELSVKSEVPVASTSTQADFMSSGVMAFKRRNLGSRYKPYLGELLDPQAQIPTWVEPTETLPSNGSWSSSSYRSLASKYGQPDICKLCDSPTCNLPLVEGHHRDCIPMSKSVERTHLERKSTDCPKEDVSERSKSSERSREDVSSRSSTSSEDKSNILSYVQIIAQKYLKKQQEEFEERASSSRVDEIRPEEVPERVILGGLFSSKESESFAIPVQSTSNKNNAQLMGLQDRSVTSDEKSLTKPEQDQFVQRCHEILSEKLSNLFTEDVEEEETDVLSTLKSAVAEEGKAKLSPGDFVYHELSTILEMDSALTNDMPSLKDASKKTSRSSSLSSISRMSGELISPEEVDTASASLVDVPVSEAAELAKNIQFVAEPSKSVAEPQTPLGLISGNLTSFQTPSPQVVTEQTKEARSVTKSTKAPELLESKTPSSSVTGIPSDIQTPSPYVSTGALTRKPFTSELLTTPSQITVSSGISTPSILKTGSSSTVGSKDLLTPTSQLSPQSHPSESVEVIPFSSSLRFKNVRYPYLTNLTDDLPQYFKDISNIQQENLQEDGKPTVPKTIASDPTSNQRFFPKHFDGKFHTDEDSSNSFKPMTPRSYVSSPGALPTDPHAKAKPDYDQQRKESRNKFQREETSSSSFKPMTPQSYVSSQGPLHSDHDKKSKERSPKYNSQATGSSHGSYKPMTPHSYYSEGGMHTEIDNKSKNAYPRELEIPKSTNGPLHSTENTHVSYKPLQSRFLLPSPIEKQGQTDRLDTFTNRYFSNLKATSIKKGSGSQNTNSSSSNYQPMIPHTSTPSNFSVQDKDSHKTKSPTRTPSTNAEPESSESEVSTPRTISPVQKIKDWITSPTEGMTPHYHISSPNLPSESRGPVQENKDKPTNAKAWMPTKDSVQDFQAMAPPLSYMSEPNLNSLGAKRSPEKKRNQNRMLSPLRNEQYLSDNDDFQPMTPYTYQSTPDLPSHIRKGPTEENSGQQSVATENGFQPMTPHSYVSSEENLRSSSSSLKLKLKIPIHLINSSSQETAHTEDDENGIPSTRSSKYLGLSAKSQNYQNEGLKDSQGEHKAKKVPRSDFFVPQLSLADIAIDKHAQKSQKDAENPGVRNEIVDYLLKDSSNEKKAKKVPRSDFFVPQLSAADLAIDQKLEKDQESPATTKSSSSGLLVAPKSTPRTNKGYFTSSISEVSSIRSSDIRTCTDSATSVGSDIKTSSDSTPSSSSCVSSLNTRELLKDGTASSKTGCGSISSLSSGTPNFSVESPNPILEALRKKFALSCSSQASSLYSSPFSTQGPSSDSSVSKISGESTPLKTIEDIIQETGIMDEPDLTLVTTNLTIKPGSPERTRLFSENRSLMTDRQDQAIRSNNDVTTDNKAGNSYADSPSMMSFLQHENSCLRDSSNGGRQFNRNQLKFDYQKRTKRLWNNLEEVKTKKMMEEKKKKIAENRLKMKAYTKVYKKN